MRTLFALPLVAILFAANPLAAQTFDLPPGSTPTPEVEGPVDDSAGVPVRPRAIPTATPTPRPTAARTQQPVVVATPAPSPTTRPTTSAQPRVGPTSAPTPRATQPAPDSVLREVPPPVELPAPQPLPPTGETPVPLPTTAPTAATPAAEPEAAAGYQQYWPWLLGALALLLAAGGAIFLVRRRAVVPPPTIEPPIVGGATTPAAAVAKPRFELMLDVERVSRSMMMLSVKYHLNVANRGDRAIRDLAVHADLTSADRGSSETTQLAGPNSNIPLAETIDRIGPHQSRTVTGTLQIPIRELSIFAHGTLPAVVPLIRVLVGGETIEPVARTFVVGVPADPMNARFQPLSLGGPPGSYAGVRAKALA